MSISAREGNTSRCQDIIMELWGSGYAASDIIQTLFRVSTVSCDYNVCLLFLSCAYPIVIRVVKVYCIC